MCLAGRSLGKYRKSGSSIFVGFFSEELEKALKESAGARVSGELAVIDDLLCLRRWHLFPPLADLQGQLGAIQPPLGRPSATQPEDLSCGLRTRSETVT